MGKTTKKTPPTERVIQKYGIRWIFPPGVGFETDLSADTILGREPPSVPLLRSAEVSRRHAKIETRPDGTLTIVDLNSSNGVQVNGNGVQRLTLVPGDVLRLGDHVGVVGPRSGGGDPPLEVTELKVGKHTSFAGRALRAAIERAKKLAVAPEALCLAIEAPHVTGARAVALAFHEASRLHDAVGAKGATFLKSGAIRPFVRVECSFLGDAASEKLFGTWDGVSRPKRSSGGIVFSAGSGTIFFEDIARLAPAAQSMLLKALDQLEHDVAPGKDLDRLRFVVSAKKSLAALAADNALSTPLRLRLEKRKVRIAPLAELKAEIPQFVDRIISNTLPAVTYDAKFIEALCVHDWPEDVDELVAIVQAVIATREGTTTLSRAHAEQLLAKPPPVSPVSLPPSPVPADPSTTILFLAASPKGEPALRTGTELRNIEDKLKVESARFTLIPSFAVRRSEVIQRIQKHKPAVVHFSGHGTPDGELIFEDESGGPAPAPVEAIGDMFRILSSTGIRCVVLNACYSARQAEIISRHVACVVGMGRTVRDEAASIFAGQFYTSLLEGCSFDKAFKLARVQIDLNLMSDSDVPRLLCRAGVDPRVEGLVG